MLEIILVRFVHYFLWIYSDLREDVRYLVHNSIEKKISKANSFNNKLRLFHSLFVIHFQFHVIDFQTKIDMFAIEYLRNVINILVLVHLSLVRVRIPPFLYLVKHSRKPKKNYSSRFEYLFDSLLQFLQLYDQLVRYNDYDTTK